MHQQRALSMSTNVALHQRRRKKRPNYGTRTVEVRRGYNNFGFTITGQQPCRLSCIVADSPADQAGLRNGDFLISINGLNVSKLPHETVVQLIGNSFGSIRMQIAENYYSDSSDEENATSVNVPQQQQQQQINNTTNVGIVNNINNWRGAKPRYLHHRAKLQQRMRNSPQKKRLAQQQQQQQANLNIKQHNEAINAVSACAAAAALEIQTLRPLIEDMPLPLKSSAAKNNKANTTVSPNVANVSAMVRVPTAALEYRAIVGYMGTIEMPKQISHSSKLQTVRSCIRKLRQEKRQPTTVLMIILPDCLRLQSVTGNVLASYNSARLNYVSSSSESENRFFGLITSAVHTDDKDDDMGEEQEEPAEQLCSHISISNSCHVFVVDTKLCEHHQHVARAHEFHIQCTRDPISNMCLEFPNNSEYVVNLIRSMYTMRILPPATRHTAAQNPAGEEGAIGGAAAHSPQPSNHSEISTTTSNSDSGIGFPNDCTNISDRIVVVDFPGVPELRMRSSVGQRPAGIFNNFDPSAPSVSHQSAEKRLTVRAMPDPKTTETALSRPNLLANFSLIKSPANSLTATRSCDDVLALMERGFQNESEQENNYDILERSSRLMHASMDDISLHSTATASTAAANDQEHVFLHPACLGERKQAQKIKFDTPDKLRPQVFTSPIKATKNKENQSKREESKEVEVKKKKTRFSLGFQAFDESNKRAPIPLSFDMDTWSSLQNLSFTTKKTSTLDITNSEPDLGNQVVPTNASPFRRAWGQSSFRPECEDKASKENIQNNKLTTLTTSMTASDNDVYLKSSMDAGADFRKELKQALSQQQINVATKSNEIQTTFANHSNNNVPQINIRSDSCHNEQSTGPLVWGTSFERMLDDPAGLQTFAEFLKKEFSAENIYFWAACERYKQIENETERSAAAKDIFQKHLSNVAMEPVNVDSQARNLSEEKLANPELNIFAPAQKQIYNLMKFDSYPRFIRSDLYKTCLEAEQKKQPLPYKAEDLEDLLRLNLNHINSSKLKPSNSNAEDRRRKSLLPWHRKTRSKSRDRPDNCEHNNNNNNKISSYLQTTGIKLPTLSTSSSLKIPSTTQNSMSDLHSSRSSLSSFDTLPSQSNGNVHDICSLCRVILSDGATTIVQTRPGETVGQMVERLLEKRGLNYEHYDILTNGSRKSIDLSSSAQATVAGKEVIIEKRVVFKIDLPDPKVISVKSKPKKLLHEVISQILLKYNYNMNSVQVIMGDTLEVLDLSLPVTVADGKRLQIVQLSQNSVSNDNFRKPAVPSLKFPKTTRTESSFQGALDEINNKVFDEVLKIRFQANNKAPLAETHEDCSLKSDDCASETSSIFDRLRRRDTNIPVFKMKSRKKSLSSQHSEENNKVHENNRNSKEANEIELKKPIIAKLKAGVKLQVTERVAELQDELPEGSKRLLSTTELIADTTDPLKSKENISIAASKLRKVKANLSPLPKYPQNDNKSHIPALEKRPQPAPRLSIVNKQKNAISPTTTDNNNTDADKNLTTACSQVMTISLLEAESVNSGRGPPPLPPKPKVFPTKPSNWTANSTSTNTQSPTSSKPIGRRSIPCVEEEAVVTVASRDAFLETPASSFV